jgi:alpha-L-fucosidase 2
VLIITISTDYKQEWPDYKGIEPELKSREIIRAAKDAEYETLKKEHIEDYTELFCSKIQIYSAGILC